LAAVGKTYHEIKDTKDQEMVLRKRLASESVRKILGFGPLKLVKAGEWVEDVKTDVAFERT
jgi:hypothetical protein